MEFSYWGHLVMDACNSSKVLPLVSGTIFQVNKILAAEIPANMKNVADKKTKTKTNYTIKKKIRNNLYQKQYVETNNITC